MSTKISLDDKYTAQEGRVFLTGTQALVRLPMVQMKRDREAGLNTASFVSGYRGSPLGSFDMQMMRAKKFLDKMDVTFQPGLNEDLAATAIWGTQQVSLSSGFNRDGVLGLWYGKGPGVDRSGDALKHGNAAGSSAHGGVLAFAGDDHTCKSSSIPHQSDHAFISALMPMLYPSSMHEFIELGLLGIAMSRYSGCWVGYKVISETVETTSVIDLKQEKKQFVLPGDFEIPEGGLNLRWPDPPLVQDTRLQELKGYAAIAFARANNVDLKTITTKNARIGIVASGKAYEDVCQALIELGIGKREIGKIGITLYKVRMPWPLEPIGIRKFSEGLEEILIVEERREIIENQIKQQLFNWRPEFRPRVVGKFDENERPFFSLSSGLTVSAVARAIADRLLKLDLPDCLADRIAKKAEILELQKSEVEKKLPPVIRQPHFCAGCPHNTSTRVPKGSKAMAGIGCHFMAQWMDRDTETFTHMGAEGVPWIAISKYTDENHRFVNLGDGTYFHSGILAIRASVAAKSNITYKVLFNDAVAMTGGQPLDGELTPQQITHQLYHENVSKIVLLSDNPDHYPVSELAPGAVVKHRDYIDTVMRDLRNISGVTAIVYVQTCAAELRRLRKRKLADDPNIRLFINPAVCEGCGDCSAQSNCIAIEPLETEMGRKRQINQSTCNKDLSCLKGFCPAFVTVRGGQLKRQRSTETSNFSTLPEPIFPSLDKPWNIVVTGVGGTGVLTIGALLGMAAHIEGKNPLIMDMAGLAQKGGAVISHIRISNPDQSVRSPRIANGSADVLIAADTVVAASKDAAILCDQYRTNGIVNTKTAPLSDFVNMRDFDFQTPKIENLIQSSVKSSDHFLPFAEIALDLAGDEIATNIVMLGYSLQMGLVPIHPQAIEEAIRLNNINVDTNLTALNWGRLMAHEPNAVMSKLQQGQPSHHPEIMSLKNIIEHRRAHLKAYQNTALADRYSKLVNNVRMASEHIPDCLAITRTVALSYSKLLAYKDEYEIARLYSSKKFEEKLNNQFEGDFQIYFNLAAPFIPGKSPNGRPLKREFGQWIIKLFCILAYMKGLRGTVFDIFGYNSERRSERNLISEFESDVKLVLSKLNKHNSRQAIELLSSVMQIRGFGPVKRKAISEHTERRMQLLKNF